MNYPGYIGKVKVAKKFTVLDLKFNFEKNRKRKTALRVLNSVL